MFRSLGIELSASGGLAEALKGLGLTGLMIRITEALARVFAEMRRPLYVLIDEFHMLPRYVSLREALRDLEAAAATLAKDWRGSGIKLITTVSEGFAAAAEALWLLSDLDACRAHGYESLHRAIQRV